MARSTPVIDEPFHVRSNSMPSESNSLSLKVQETMQKLRTSLASLTSCATPQIMSNGLQELGDMYGCIEELLRLPCNQQTLFNSHQKKLVEAELDASCRLLDLCGALRESLDSTKEHVQDLQSLLPRKYTAIQSKMHAYIRSRKNAKKVIKRSVGSLKQIDNKCRSYQTLDKDCDLLLVVNALTEAREVTISLIQPVSSSAFIPKRPRQKASRWSFLSNTLHKGMVSCEDENGEGDISFQAFYECISCQDVDNGRVQMARHELQTLEASIQGLQSGLECLFKKLIQIRVSLLNIASL